MTTFDLKRFNAVRGYQAQQGRELSRCLKELRLLRREPLAECTDEPEPMPQNEPDELRAPANDDGPPPGHACASEARAPLPNEPGLWGRPRDLLPAAAPDPEASSAAAGRSPPL